LTGKEHQGTGRQQRREADEADSYAFEEGTVHRGSARFNQATAGDAASESRHPIDVYGTGHPEAYAGLYWRRGVPVVGFTRDAERHLAELRRLTDERVELASATWTLAELEQAVHRIVTDDPILLEQDIDVQAVGVDIERNVVAVGVLALTQAKEELLKARYGPLVRVRDEEIVAVNRDP
jgi:hypothetical protein